MDDQTQERLLDEVYKQIRDDFLTRGWSWAAIATLPIPVDEWRRLARTAGRILRRPVRTKIFDGQAVAAKLHDWGRTQEEYEVRIAEDRALQLQMANAILEKYPWLTSGVQD